MTPNYMRPQQFICVVLLSIWVVHFFYAIYYLEDVSGWIWNQNLTYPDGVITPWQPAGEHDGIEIYILFNAIFFMSAFIYGACVFCQFSVRRVFVLLLLLCACEQSINFCLWLYGTKIKEASLILNLKQNPVLQQASIIFIEDDQFLMDYPNSIISLPKVMVTSPFTVQLAGNPQLIMPNLDKHEQNTLLNETLFPQINYLGCRASLVIFKGDRQHDRFGLVIRYLATRFFRPATLSSFLSHLTYLRVTPIHTNVAQNCNAW